MTVDEYPSCCPGHRWGGTGSCLSQMFHHGEPCCAGCPVWFPKCFWCDVHHAGDGYKYCYECDHLYRTKRELRQAMRRPFLVRVLKLRRPWIKDSNLENAWWRDLWAAMTVTVKRCYFCPLCAHDF